MTRGFAGVSSLSTRADDIIGLSVLALSRGNEVIIRALAECWSVLRRDWTEGIRQLKRTAQRNKSKYDNGTKGADIKSLQWYVGKF